MPWRAKHLLLEKQNGQGFAVAGRGNVKYDGRNVVQPAQRGGATVPAVVKNQTAIQVEDEHGGKFGPKGNRALICGHLAPGEIARMEAMV